jgi:hypothetical protein
LDVSGGGETERREEVVVEERGKKTDVFFSN